MVGETRHATAFLGLGSNLGDRLSLMRAAVAAIDAADGVHVDGATGVASLFETVPVGASGPQANFFNSAIRVTTSLEPVRLLHTLQDIETSLGRVRPAKSVDSVDMRSARWDARTVDIDLLLYEDRTCDDDLLTLPHPRMHLRRFVLDPLSEIAGDRTHPIEGVTIKALLLGLASGGSAGTSVRIAGPDWFQSCPQ